MAEYDVAIVGYGPTGMTLAALLGQLRRRVIVLERYTGLYNLPRAACFDDEIMRTFQKLGIAEDVARGAVAQRGYDWINAAGQTLVSFEYDNPAHCGWPQLYMMYQPHMEDVLDRHVTSLPTVEVRQGVTVSALTQEAEFVTLRGTNQSGDTVAVDARWVVGADGGNGVVRKALASHVSDYGFQENWLVCDFRMLRKVENLPTFRQICNPAQPQSIVTIGPHHHRFSFMLNPDDTPDEVTHPEGVWARVAKHLTKDDAELIRVANYTFRSRIAEKWREGRVLLAGDAAHEMPPFLAQGMCSGIRDSHNLAWKLDLVLAGRRADLLDTYQPEREPHVRFITERAIELGRVQTMRDPVKARERDERLLAQRRANQGPSKLRFPALNGGLIADHGGLFPQGRVRSKSRTSGLFDDLMGSGWYIIAQDPKLLDALSVEQRDEWQAIGGWYAAFGPSPDDGVLEDVDGIYTRWFADNSCVIAVVRPDWHIYGTARSTRELVTLLDKLAVSLLRQEDLPMTHAPTVLPSTPTQSVMHGKVALEEHFAIPDTLQDSAGFVPEDHWIELKARLLDMQDRRLREMDMHGIEIMLPSLNAPAVQAIPDRKKAVEIARRANDFLAGEVGKRPDRFRGLAALPMQDPEVATQELTRCVRELGFVGALVNGFSQIDDPANATYYDLPQYRPFWAEVERLDVPFYLHPRNPLPSHAQIYEGHPWLLGPTWAFGQETAVHALRLMASGLFDVHPRLQIILGHMGEGLPYAMWRVDNRNGWVRAPKKYPAKKPLGSYFRENFYITTSGNFRTQALIDAMLEIGADRILFSADWPFENIDHAAEWFDVCTISEADRLKIGRTNSMKLFKLRDKKSCQ